MSSFNGRVGPLTIATDGLVGCWDAAVQRSYPGSGTLWKDISGQGNDATASGGPIFVNQYGGYFSAVSQLVFYFIMVLDGITNTLVIIGL